MPAPRGAPPAGRASGAAAQPNHPRLGAARRGAAPRLAASADRRGGVGAALRDRPDEARRPDAEAKAEDEDNGAAPARAARQEQGRARRAEDQEDSRHGRAHHNRLAACGGEAAGGGPVLRPVRRGLRQAPHGAAGVAVAPVLRHQPQGPDQALQVGCCTGGWLGGRRRRAPSLARGRGRGAVHPQVGRRADSARGGAGRVPWRQVPQLALPGGRGWRRGAAAALNLQARPQDLLLG
mmetsp:Transcript_38866/g.129997  ORF Transcript_38866/g.129997 Transcript_38866/m.129997 type:complete len:237 (-) Transcript_38866:1730-2440(-)